MYSILPWCFTVWCFLVSFWLNQCVFPLSGLLQALLIHLSYCLSIQLFLYAFGCHILVQNCSVSLESSYWYDFVSSSPSCWQNFLLCFGMSRFVSIALLFFYISLIFLLSSVLSSLFLQLVLLLVLILPFPFFFSLQDPASYFVLSFWPFFVKILFAFPVECPVLILIFPSFFLRGSQFSHKLISPQHRLYCSLI